MTKKNLLFLVMVLLAFVDSWGNHSKDSIIVSYELLENNSPQVKECMDVEPQYAFDVTLKGKLDGTPYRLYQVHVKDGKTDRVKIEWERTCRADSIQHFLFASIMENKDTVRIVCHHQVKDDLRIAIPGYYCILMETYPSVKQTKDEAIPLIAFTEGRREILEIDGRKREVLDFCDVRDANIHPGRWFEEFNIKNYVYFEIEFECK